MFIDTLRPIFFLIGTATIELLIRPWFNASGIPIPPLGEFILFVFELTCLFDTSLLCLKSGFRFVNEFLVNLRATLLNMRGLRDITPPLTQQSPDNSDVTEQRSSPVGKIPDKASQPEQTDSPEGHRQAAKRTSQAPRAKR